MATYLFLNDSTTERKWWASVQDRWCLITYCCDDINAQTSKQELGGRHHLSCDRSPFTSLSDQLALLCSSLACLIRLNIVSSSSSSQLYEKKIIVWFFLFNVCSKGIFLPKEGGIRKLILPRDKGQVAYTLGYYLIVTNFNISYCIL